VKSKFMDPSSREMNEGSNGIGRPCNVILIGNELGSIAGGRA
jgi:hypothetical protein